MNTKRQSNPIAPKEFAMIRRMLSRPQHPGTFARELVERGIDPDIWEDFEIGYVDSHLGLSGENSIQFLVERQLNAMHTAGLDVREGYSDTDFRDWRLVDISDLRLEGVNLEDAKLQGARMVNTYLAYSEMAGADLEGADLTGANLDDADLHKANLKDSLLNGTGLLGAELNNANLQGVDLGKIANPDDFDTFGYQNALYDKKTQFSPAQEMMKLEMIDVDSEFGKNLEERQEGFDRDFDENRTNFSGKDLRGLDLSEIDLSNHNFKNSRLQQAVLVESILNRALFQKANLSNARLNSTQLEGTNFSKAILKNADFDRAIGGDVRFAGAKGENLQFLGGYLGFSNMEEVQFPLANFRHLNASVVSFKDANLQNSVLSHGTFDDCDFVNANLNGCFVYMTRFRNCDFSGADLRGIDEEGRQTSFDNCLYDRRTKFSEGFDPESRGMLLKQG